MTLKTDLLARGYLPENLPPSFTTAPLALSPVLSGGSELSEERPRRASPYNASKRGMSRRVFSVLHPASMHDQASFIDRHHKQIDSLLIDKNFSLSVPEHSPEGDRAISIASHTELEREKLVRLAGYRFIVKTDISRFYHTIYTHAIPWAFHGKAHAKKDTKKNSRDTYFNALDFFVRNGQDNQTLGIPVGPDTSRYIAELIAHAIDKKFQDALRIMDYRAIRHVDDIWIGTHSLDEAEQALGCYRESVREYELDLNDTKTKIYSEHFEYCDLWPTEIEERIRRAHERSFRRDDHLRSALEFAFATATQQNDDGILKYTIRTVDRNEWAGEIWSTFEPFLMRCAIHFGHAIDYVARVLVWRDITKGDLDKTRWSELLIRMLTRQSRLGNDSEVCWILFACQKLRIQIPALLGEQVLQNAGYLPRVSILNCVEDGLANMSLYSVARDLLSLETGRGAAWPLYLEWLSKEWPKVHEIQASVEDEVISALSRQGAFIFDRTRQTRVFEGLDDSQITHVNRAIETRTSFYDDDDKDPAIQFDIF